jgi:hypothetical protein
MKKLSIIVIAVALAAVLVASFSASAFARGSGGPASAHRGCMSNNGIPLDDGQSVVVDGVTITCNNGTVCHFAKGRFPLCYVNVQAAQATIGPSGSTSGGGKKILPKTVKRAPAKATR